MLGYSSESSTNQKMITELYWRWKSLARGGCHARLNSAAARLGNVPQPHFHPSLGCLFASSRLSRNTREEVYLPVVEAEVLMTTCHYCERVLKQGCRNEESFQAEVTESKRYWPVTLVGWCYWETQVRQRPCVCA